MSPLIPRVSLFAALALTPAALAQPTFRTISGLGPQAVSADGRVIVGENTSGAAYWSAGTGLVALGNPAGCHGARANGVSGDGTVIAGTALNGSGARVGFRWTAASGFTTLTCPGAVAIDASCVSRDGRVIAGAAIPPTGYYTAFVWTEEEGGRMVPQGSNYLSWLHALTADGNSGVGSGTSNLGTWAVLWQSTYLWPLSVYQAPNSRPAFALAMTAQGSAFCGYTMNPYDGVYWNSQTGVQTVQPLAGFNTLGFTCMSDDARVVGGYVSNSTSTSGGQGVIWSPGGQLLLVKNFAASNGLNTPTGLAPVVGVSADGRTIVGGTTSSGRSAWVIQLPHCGSSDFNHDGDAGTDQDIEAFFRCLAGNCCPYCESADFNYDGDTGTDQDIEAFFRVLGGGAC